MKIESFENALLARGAAIAHLQVFADGKNHRLKAIDDKGGKQSISYMLLSDNSFGYYQNYKDGLGVQHWFPSQKAQLTSNERKLKQERLQLAKQQQAETTKNNNNEAALKAQNIYYKAKLASTHHPYLLAKQIAPCKGMRESNGMLLIPLYYGREICNLQTIALHKQGDGNGFTKLFLKGGRVKGAYFLIGKMDNSTKEAILCEGYATGKTLYDAFGLPVIICFTANNLQEVGENLLKAFPHLTITIAGDDDYQSKENIGIIKAYHAANALSQLRRGH